MPQDVKVNHTAGELPGGVPVLFGFRGSTLDVVFNKSATAEEIARALGPMSDAMACTTAALKAVA